MSSSFKVNHISSVEEILLLQTFNNISFENITILNKLGTKVTHKPIISCLDVARLQRDCHLEQDCTKLNCAKLYISLTLKELLYKNGAELPRRKKIHANNLH